MVQEKNFKDLLSSTCQVSVESDLESETMRGPDSIPTVDNILSLEFFCFQVVKMKMPQLAFLWVCEKPYWLALNWSTALQLNNVQKFRI